MMSCIRIAEIRPKTTCTGSTRVIQAYFSRELWPQVRNFFHARVREKGTCFHSYGHRIFAVMTRFCTIALSAFASVFFLSAVAVAQPLTVSSPVLAFDTTLEIQADSLPLIIGNPLDHDVQVTGIRFYNTYGQPAFHAGQSQFTVPGLSSDTVWITFSPRHNIFHRSELVLENNSHRGFVSVELTGQGRYSKAYYDSSENKEEEDLKSALNTLTGNGYISLGYNPARDSMYMVIDNKRVNGQGASQNTLECVYTGRQAVGYIDRTDCQTSFSFNTEHTWPQSLFSSLEPMKSDLHHLFPTDDTANNVRANYPFGVVSSPSWQSGGSRYANMVFEPRDLQKGATARAMLYFVIRYQNYGNFLNTQESVLRNWNRLFPPSAVEQARNQKISTLQMNRNPFVDYPQFADRISSFSSFSSAPVNVSADYPETVIDYGYVASSVSHRYRYVVVNNGNQAIQFSNFSLAPSALFSFAGGSGVNTTVQPGEALILDIDLLTAPAGAITGSLDFQTTLPGQSTVSVPIHVDGASPVAVHEADRENMRIYPNPAASFLAVKWENHTVTGGYITDALGKIVAEFPVPAQQHSTVIATGDLSRGMYFIHLTGSTGDLLVRRFLRP
jgi:hypothetical protein